MLTTIIVILIVLWLLGFLGRGSAPASHGRATSSIRCSSSL